MTSAEHFISLITVASAKKLATALILCFIFYHGMLHIIYGKTKNVKIFLTLITLFNSFLNSHKQ